MLARLVGGSGGASARDCQVDGRISLCAVFAMRGDSQRQDSDR